MKGIYFLFAGMNYYPGGGAHDFVGIIPAGEDNVKDVALQHVPEDTDWWHVMTFDGTIVAQSH